MRFERERENYIKTGHLLSGKVSCALSFLTRIFEVNDMIKRIVTPFLFMFIFAA